MLIKAVTRRPASGNFYDVTVAKNHNFLANGVLVHNCNTSAQNVVIVGTTRGLSEVDELDIIQSGGRAGRFGKAPEGHVYLICDSIKQWQIRLKDPRPVTSTLLDEDALAFHICAEIRNKIIVDTESLYQWYFRTLASIQEELTLDKIDKVMANLQQWECVKVDERGFFQCTPLGVVSATLYYHPKDVHHWAKSFYQIDQYKLWENDACLAYALVAPTMRLPYIPRNEMDDVMDYMAILMKDWRGKAQSSTLAKDVYNLLAGKDPSRAAKAFRSDSERVVAALQWISGIKRLARTDMLDIIPMRLKYGVPASLVQLVQLPKIGAVRAKKLAEVGVKTWQDVVANPSKIQAVVGSAMAPDVIRSARQMIRATQTA